MTTLQALIIAIVQGATELFPISSLGHAVILPALLHWSINQDAPSFLPFLVMLHLGTATALLAYFWRDWLALILGVLGLRPAPESQAARRLLLLIIIATIPAVIIGGLFEHRIRLLFASPLISAAFLVVNGLILLLAQRFKDQAGRGERKPLSTLSTMDAAVVGVWQCLAFLPGLSRSGATIVGGFTRRLDAEAAAHFSFLIATPVILGATVKEVPKLLHASVPPGTFQTAILGAVVAGIVAFLSTAFLMRYFRDHERWALNPFAWYCVIAGVASLVLLYAGI